jgi:hypothetical protein
VVGGSGIIQLLHQPNYGRGIPQKSLVEIIVCVSHLFSLVRFLVPPPVQGSSLDVRCSAFVFGPLFPSDLSMAAPTKPKTQPIVE